MAAVLLIGGIVAILWVIILVNADPEDMREFRGEDEEELESMSKEDTNEPQI